MAEQRKRTLYRLAVTAVGIVILFTCVNFGSAATVFIGIPALLIACGIAAGARLPYKIPLRDTLLYVAISVLLVASIVIWAAQTTLRNSDIDINNRWIAFSFLAIFVFGFVAKDFRHHRRRPVFWATFAALLAAHFVILSHVFPAHEQVPFLLAIPLSIAEMFAVYILLGVSGFPLKPHDDGATPPSL
jgi:peptidoglycan/LPS O-acetylase OafA/YrhL